jgi:hypothetical protein
MSTKYYKYMPLAEENSGRGVGVEVDSSKTSPSQPGSTSGVQPPKRRRGGQPGNSQALKHGAYTAENIGLKRGIRAFMRRARDFAEEVEVRYGGRPRRRRRKAAPA